jgi:anthranilate synthase/aminodeoxychorismate synthase-like glutamine amidotransferase
MRVLFVENRDSFSWNVADRLPCRREEIVWASTSEAVQGDGWRSADVVVVGPGPMDPERTGLVPFVQKAIAAGRPLLGICLGHQAIGLACGARLVRGAPVHGRRDVATFSANRWLSGVEGDHEVMRYHSLSLEAVPAPLEVVARTPGGVVMAVAHETRPVVGLQFHPDSFATPHGEAMLAAFFRSVA